MIIINFVCVVFFSGSSILLGCKKKKVIKHWFSRINTIAVNIRLVHILHYIHISYPISMRFWICRGKSCDSLLLDHVQGSGLFIDIVSQFTQNRKSIINQKTTGGSDQQASFHANYSYTFSQNGSLTWIPTCYSTYDPERIRNYCCWLHDRSAQ